MQRWNAVLFVFAGFLAISFAPRAFAADAQKPDAAWKHVQERTEWQTFDVAKTFNDSPFSYRIKLLAERPGYKVYRLYYPSPFKSPHEANNTVPADYYLPDGIRKGDPRRPAVICMHILDGNDALTDLMCSTLVQRGVPAIMFKLPYYGERELPGGPEAMAHDPSLFAGAVEQASLDVRRTIDLLASREEIDSNKIGIAGISLGGIISAVAAGGEPRINRAGLILAGGDLLAIINHARETRPLKEMIERLPLDKRLELETKINAVDPLRFSEGLKKQAAAGKVLMVNAAEDEVIPRSCTVKLAAAMGMTDKVVWLPGLGHYTAMAELPKTLKQTAEFFAQDLPAEAKPPVASVNKQTPLQVVAQTLQEAGAMLGDPPAKGKCHLCEMSAKIEINGQKPLEGHFRYVRGADERFAVTCQLPKIGEAAFGQGDYPWLASSKRVVFVGMKKAAAGRIDPLTSIDPQLLTHVRMLSGLLSGVSTAPEVLLWHVSVDEAAKTAAGARTFDVKWKKDQRFNVKIAYKDDGKTLDSIAFDSPSAKGEVKIIGWKTDSVEQNSYYAPPADLLRREVSQEDLYRVFQAMLNFALESME